MVKEKLSIFILDLFRFTQILADKSRFSQIKVLICVNLRSSSVFICENLKIYFIFIFFYQIFSNQSFAQAKDSIKQQKGEPFEGIDMTWQNGSDRRCRRVKR